MLSPLSYPDHSGYHNVNLHCNLQVFLISLVYYMTLIAIWDTLWEKKLLICVISDKNQVVHPKISCQYIFAVFLVHLVVLIREVVYCCFFRLNVHRYEQFKQWCSMKREVLFCTHSQIRLRIIGIEGERLTRASLFHVVMLMCVLENQWSQNMFISSHIHHFKIFIFPTELSHSWYVQKVSVHYVQRWGK